MNRSLYRVAPLPLLVASLCLVPGVGTKSLVVQDGSAAVQDPGGQGTAPDHARLALWKQRWQKSILDDARARYCDSAMGEEVGWLISPLLSGFYYGYLATADMQWIDRLVDWTDSWIRRGVIEPDGYLGWPKVGAAGTNVDDLNSYYADSLVGEAMVLRPIVLMSHVILTNHALRTKYGSKAVDYLKLAQSIFDKWDKRGAWRATDDGLVTVVLPFGVDRANGRWTDGYEKKEAPGHGFSHPDNKANLVALWLLAMFDATANTVYKERAEKWFRTLRSRIRFGTNGAYPLWNYWEPAGAWDYTMIGTPKHWIGIHRNPGYYAIDVEAIAAAYEHGLIFTAEDIAHLIKIASANSRLWPALVPYDDATRKHFEDSLKPEGWAGLSLVPWYLALQSH